MALGCNPAMAFPQVFWQTGQYFGIFSTGIESGGFTRFSGIGREIRKGNGARIGLICPHGPDHHTSGAFFPLPDPKKKEFLIRIPAGFRARMG